MFDFKHIQPFDKSMIHAHTPMVLFATPGMLHGGLSLAVFKEWCGDPKNALIIPGYCSPGTVGHMLLKGTKHIEIDNRWLQVRCEIHNMSFSAHADAKGILKMAQHVQPDNIILLHGEKETMSSFGSKIKDVVRVPIFTPENNKVMELDVRIKERMWLSRILFETLEDSRHYIRSLGPRYAENIDPVLRISTNYGADERLMAKDCPIHEQAAVSCSVRVEKGKTSAAMVDAFKSRLIEYTVALKQVG